MKAKNRPSRRSYPSDVTVEQFARIKPLLESCRKKTRPLDVDLREVFNAVLYVLREGCRWRSLPHDFPKPGTVYYHFSKWRDHIDEATGRPLLELVLKKIHPGGTATGRS
jgi:transposase